MLLRAAERENTVIHETKLHFSQERLHDNEWAQLKRNEISKMITYPYVNSSDVHGPSHKVSKSRPTKISGAGSGPRDFDGSARRAIKAHVGRAGQAININAEKLLRQGP